MIAQIADLRLCALMYLRPCVSVPLCICALMFLCPYVLSSLCLRHYVLQPFVCALMSAFDQQAALEEIFAVYGFAVF